MMEIISRSNDEDTTKLMEQMEFGEVCYDIKDSCYVIRVTRKEEKNCVFLVLGEGDLNIYSGTSCTAKVRQLNENESITIKFSGKEIE
ncbi:hypothetical protein LCGC14_2349370 [marine sediment metagenome]|uniref:Uncharacterized protein n=1 Tax=marine sediment metagenome TaxID=412755 RepID=A0A0F9EMB5_9ZZZZ